MLLQHVVVGGRCAAKRTCLRWRQTALVIHGIGSVDRRQLNVVMSVRDWQRSVFVVRCLLEYVKRVQIIANIWSSLLSPSPRLTRPPSLFTGGRYRPVVYPLVYHWFPSSSLSDEKNSCEEQLLQLLNEGRAPRWELCGWRQRRRGMQDQTENHRPSSPPLVMDGARRAWTRTPRGQRKSVIFFLLFLWSLCFFFYFFINFVLGMSLVSAFFACLFLAPSFICCSLFPDFPGYDFILFDLTLSSALFHVSAINFVKSIRHQWSEKKLSSNILWEFGEKTTHLINEWFSKKENSSNFLQKKGK